MAFWTWLKDVPPKESLLFTSELKNGSKYFSKSNFKGSPSFSKIKSPPSLFIVTFSLGEYFKALSIRFLIAIEKSLKLTSIFLFSYFYIFGFVDFASMYGTLDP